MKRTELINLLLSLNFEVVGHGSSIDYIEPHMNFTNRNIYVILTDDNNHIYSVRSARCHLAGWPDPHEVSEEVSINDNIKKSLEAYLLPEESVVKYITNWKYEPYERRRIQEIKEHNRICKKHKMYKYMIKEE